MIEKGTIQLGDGSTMVTRRMTAPDPSRRLIITHGVSEHSGRWTHVMEFFAERGYDVLAYDLRGHGESTGTPLDISDVQEYVADLAEMVGYFDEVSDTTLPLVMYGHSMGGLITTAHAESVHRKPAVYVLSAPALDAAVPAPLVAIGRLVAKVAPGLRLPTQIRGEQLASVPAVGEAYFADPLVNTRATVRLGKALLDAMPGVSAAVGSISTPTLVIHGGEDSVVPTAASSVFEAVPGVTRKVFPGLQHEMHNEAEQFQVLGFVAGWLDHELAR